MDEKKAIIIGAGPAGLTAAYKLLKETSIKPIILEESDYIGGISRTARYHGNRMDLGGHRFFSKSKEVTDLWEEIMPLQGKPAKDDLLLGSEKNFSPNGPDPERTNRVSLLRRRVSRIFYLRHFFDYPISLKLETLLNMGFIRTLNAGCGYLLSVLHKRKENSLEDFYINRFGKPLYEMFFEDYTEKLWGIHPSKIAPDWGAQRVKGLSLSKAIFSMLKKPFESEAAKKQVETSLIEQFTYPKKGPGQLWEAMAEEIIKMGGEIYLNHSVKTLQSKNHQITSVVTKDKNGLSQSFAGDYFFSSMPIKDLIESLQAPIPSHIKSAATALPYRDFITVGLLLNQLQIKNETKLKTVSNIVPDCWIYIQERDVKLGRIQIFNNWSPYMVKDLEHTVWIGLEYFCSEGDELWSMSEKDFIEFATLELEKIDVIKKSDVLDSVQIKVKKAYPAYFGTYSQFPEIRGYLDTFANLYCIGRNGQHRYNNMDHSMLTAMEAVKIIKSGQLSKKALWEVNTEETYHEETTAPTEKVKQAQ